MGNAPSGAFARVRQLLLFDCHTCVWALRSVGVIVPPITTTSPFASRDAGVSLGDAADVLMGV